MLLFQIEIFSTHYTELHSCYFSPVFEQFTSDSDREFTFRFHFLQTSPFTGFGRMPASVIALNKLLTLNLSQHESLEQVVYELDEPFAPH